MRVPQEVLAHHQGVHDDAWNVKITLLLACTTIVERSKKGRGDGIPPAKLLPLLQREVEEESEIIIQGGRLTKSVKFPHHQNPLPREAPLLYPIARMSMHPPAARGKGMTLIVLGCDQGSFKSLKKVAKAYLSNAMMDPMAPRIRCYPLSSNSMRHSVVKNSLNLLNYVMLPCTSPKPQDNGGLA